MSKDKPKPGPKEERLSLEGPWKDRLRDALRKSRPKDGWPKSPKGKSRGKKKRAEGN